MDFFAAQDLARARTRRLVVLFGLAVLGIVASTSALAFVVIEYDRFFPRDPAQAVASGPLAQVFLEHLDVFGLVAAVTLAIVGLSSGFKWLQVRAGGSAVAEMMGGRPVDPSTTDPFERRLVNVVEEMAIASGIPLPEVYVLPEEASINAFAAGLTTSDAAVAVTQGCLEKLSRDELQGVIAHEVGHVLNGDMKLNVQLIALLHGILVFAILGRIVIRTALHSGSRRGSRNNPGGMLALIAAGVALVVIGYAGYFFGRLIQAAVSRQREYLADASAVQFTRNPSGLLGALKKIGGYSHGSKMSHPRSAEVSHALFAQGFRSSFVGLLATHPALPDRIRALDPAWDGALAEVPDHAQALDALRAEAPRRVASGAVAGPVAVGAGAAPSAASAMSFSPERAVAVVGTVSAANVSRARALREAMPEALHDAAHDVEAAPALVYGLLLDRRDLRARRGQIALLASEAPEDHARVESMLADLERLPAGLRLPLLQIALPALRRLDDAGRDRLFHVIHALVHFDGHVEVFEVALQQVLIHHLRLAAEPTRAKTNLRSLPHVAKEVGAILSVFARLAETEDGVSRSFAAGVARLPTIAHVLVFSPDLRGYDPLHDALAALDHTSLGIRKQVIDALAHTVGGDGTITQEEADLLRAVASVLDCPMPPL